MEQLSAHKLVTLNGRGISLREGGVKEGRSDLPLIVAVHGATYSSAYFGISGYSLLDRATALGIPAVAFDRPGYGESTIVDPVDCTNAGNAAVLDGVIGAYWALNESRARGVVLVGHSLGAAISLGIAARQPSWPLLGVVVSGIDVHHKADNSNLMDGFPELPFFSLPSAVKIGKMFGAPGTFDSCAPDLSQLADAPAPRQELIEVISAWPRDAEAILSKVKVPVQYRMADTDGFWETGDEETARFADRCSGAPWIDAALVPGAGHCIDFHRIGMAFQLEQLAFAVKCAVFANIGLSTDHRG